MRRPAVIVATLLFARTGLADSEYSIAPRMGIIGHADDNLLLASRNGIETGGADTSLSFDLNRQTESLKSDLVPRVNLRRFIVDSGFDADEYGVSLNNDWRGELFAVGLKVGYLHDSTLITEAPDTGLSKDVVDRDSINAEPTLTWFVNDRLQAQFSISFNDITYANSATGLLDYRYWVGSTTATYSCNETTQLFATFFTSDFDVPLIGNHTRTYGVQTGMAKLITPTIRATGTVGYVTSDIASIERRLVLINNPPPPHLGVVDVSRSKNSMGPIADFSLQKQIAQSSVVKLNYSRQLSPGGRGSQTIADNISLRADLKLEPKLLLVLSGSHDMRNSEGGVIASDTDRDYTELRGTLTYELTREWEISGSYHFAHRQNTGLSTASADGNGIALTIEYNGQARPLSFMNGL